MSDVNINNEAVNEKAELADYLHRHRHNCCQAVLCAFADEIGVDKEILFKACEGFGGGMATNQNTCGALSGAVMLAGLKCSDGLLEESGSKPQTYKIVREMNQRFVEKTGALLCKDLKGLETGVMLCSCPDCITAGVEVVQEVLGL